MTSMLDKLHLFNSLMYHYHFQKYQDLILNLFHNHIDLTHNTYFPKNLSILLNQINLKVIQLNNLNHMLLNSN